MTEKQWNLSEPQELAKFCVQALDKKGATDIRLLHVEEQTIIAEYYVLCCGRSTTHVSALADEVEYQTAQGGVKPLRAEGRNAGAWALMDYGSVLVHVFTKEQRDFYKLEKLYQAESEVNISDLLLPKDGQKGSEE